MGLDGLVVQDLSLETVVVVDGGLVFQDSVGSGLSGLGHNYGRIF